MCDSAFTSAHRLIRLQTVKCTCTRTYAHSCAHELTGPCTGRTSTFACAHTSDPGLRVQLVVALRTLICATPAVQLSCSGVAFYDFSFEVPYVERERERERILLAFLIAVAFG